MAVEARRPKRAPICWPMLPPRMASTCSPDKATALEGASLVLSLFKLEMTVRLTTFIAASFRTDKVSGTKFAKHYEPRLELSPFETPAGILHRSP